MGAGENSDACHMVLAPHEHASGLVAAGRTKGVFSIEPYFLDWSGAAIVQEMSGEKASEIHRDMKNYGLTCLVPL